MRPSQEFPHPNHYRTIIRNHQAIPKNHDELLNALDVLSANFAMGPMRPPFQYTLRESLKEMCLSETTSHFKTFIFFDNTGFRGTGYPIFRQNHIPATSTARKKRCLPKLQQLVVLPVRWQSAISQNSVVLIVSMPLPELCGVFVLFWALLLSTSNFRIKWMQVFIKQQRKQAMWWPNKPSLEGPIYPVVRRELRS